MYTSLSSLHSRMHYTILFIIIKPCYEREPNDYYIYIIPNLITKMRSRFSRLLLFHYGPFYSPYIYLTE